MNWQDYLTRDEQARLTVLEQKQIDASTERRLIYNRARQRMRRDLIGRD